MTRAKTLMSAKEHCFCFWGGQEIGLIIDTSGDTPNLDDRDHDASSMEEVLHPDMGDGYEEGLVLALLRSHGDILR